jgi:glutathione S-transferase
VDEVLFNVEDLGAVMRSFMYGKDEDTRAQALKDAVAGPLPTWLQRFDEAVAKNPSGYFVGDSLTIADLRVRSRRFTFFFCWCTLCSEG